MSTVALALVRGRPPGDQSLVRRRRRGHPHVHGSAGHDDRQRRPALHRRRAVGGGNRQRVGHHQLPGRQRHRAADHRLAVGHLGRRNYFLLSIAVFTLASGLCGMATSLPQMILFRVIQGLAGGGLQPSSQGVLLDSFPPEKQGTAMTLFGVAALLGPIVGPTLGGWLVDQLRLALDLLHQRPRGRVGSWRAIVLVDDPEYLKKERAELRRRPLNFDAIGLGLLALVMASWEIMLSKGQEWDWLGDPVLARADAADRCSCWGLAACSTARCGFANPIINFRVLRERNFAASASSSSASMPCCTRPDRGLAEPAADVVRLRRLSLGPGDVAVRLLLDHDDGGRRRLARPGRRRPLADRGGLLIMAAGSYWMALMNLQISPWQVVWPRVVMIVGLSLIFAPINVAAFLYTPRHLRGAAVGLLALLRNEGGSFGTSMGQTIQERREQFHLSRLGDSLGPLNPHVQSFLERGHAFFMQHTGDPAGSQQMTVQALANLRQQQAASLAYFDVFWVCAAWGVVAGACWCC